MTEKNLEKAMAAFAFKMPPVSLKRCDAGHINDTYFVDCGDKSPRYILQRVNTSIFTEPEKLVANVKSVCNHLGEKIRAEGGDPERETRTLIQTKDEKDFYIDDEGGFWRAFLEIPGVVSYEHTDSKEIHYQSALAFGRFFKMLSDYPAHELYETIPDFHNTVKRMDDFKKAVSEDRAGRGAEVEREIEFALSKEKHCSYILDGLSDGRFRVCVTHNDSKLGNVLMDKESGEGVCIIDLDNVMAGSVLFDFGDAVRSGAASVPEDHTELSEVYLDLELFELYVKGFTAALRDHMTDDELLALPMGAYLMTLETGIRFLGDYLNNDEYYHISYPEHNRDRARNQLKLVADMDSKMSKMKDIVRKYL